jgi:2-amino-4-hydroxy-6-hydroxymethyldihydropteridine diphosphokinase
MNPPTAPSPPRRRAAVALGANLGDRRATLERALALLAPELGRLVARSSWLETAAVIHPEDDAAWHPAFLNGVAVFATGLAPHDVLNRLHAVERSLGRDRRAETRPWQPRLIDLDLIALEEVVLDEPDLVLPHPRMHERAFVLRPMAEVWPDWRHPRLGLTVAELAAQLDAGVA